MKTSFVFATAVLAATSAMALPASGSPYKMSKRDFTEAQVVASINAWINNVDNVNNFLENALSEPNTDALVAAAQTALDNANDEPIQLSILSNVDNLDAAGQGAANNLEEVFGNVITQLQSLINNPTDSQNVNIALEVINNTRCNTVLPAVTTLWASAAAAVGAPVPPAAEIPSTC